MGDQLVFNINKTFVEYDYDLLDGERLQMHPFVQVVGQVVFFIYIFVILFGIPANVYVLWRMYRLAKSDHEKYMNGTGVGLLAMATADLLSLSLITLHNVLNSIPLDASSAIKIAVCKALLFSTHTVTSVSIWSWLLMSTLRYLAVRHPIYHLRLWQMPYRAIALIVFLCSLTNVWLLVAVVYDQSGCTLNSISGEGNLNANRYLHLIECIWSFCIPVIIIIYMDVRVLICRPRNILTAQISLHTKGSTNQRSKKAKSALWKWLVISFIDVLLNTPENVNRLVVLLGMPTAGPDGGEYHFAAQVIAQMLYFAQFAFNSVYLALYVFDNSTKPRMRTSAVNHTLLEASVAVELPPISVMSRQRAQSHRETKQMDICTETSLILPRRTSWHQFKTIRARAYSIEYGNLQSANTCIVR